MTKTVLIEGYNLTLPKGTGIKTYAKTLARVARDLGYDVDVLLQSSSRLNSKDPVLAEIGFYEGVARSNWKDRWLREPLEVALGRPFGLPARVLANTGVVLGESPLHKQFSHLHVAHQFLTSAKRHFWRHGELMKLRLERMPDLFHATHMAPVRVAERPNIYTIHDVIPLRLPTATLDNKKYFLKTLRTICKTADRIVTVSECSKRDIHQLTGMPEERIDVTYQSVAIPPALAARGETETANILENIFSLEPGGYFLFFGALEPKKNVSRLIDAYAASGVEAPLIIAGGLGWSYDEEVRQIEQEHFSSWRLRENEIRKVRRVRRLDHVTFSHLVALIRGARAVLFPSLYEGFGLPVLEAMTLGAPVM
jgi:glycosyltransferase involved in cell wall biosynthesis